MAVHDPTASPPRCRRLREGTATPTWSSPIAVFRAPLFGYALVEEVRAGGHTSLQTAHWAAVAQGPTALVPTRSPSVCTQVLSCSKCRTYHSLAAGQPSTKYTVGWLTKSGGILTGRAGRATHGVGALVAPRVPATSRKRFA